MGIELLERFDKFARFRNAIKTIANEREQWAGIPMPIDDLPLHVHPRYPYAEGLMAIGRKEDKDDSDIKFRNQFWSTRWRSMVAVVEYKGRIRGALMHAANQVDQLINTIGASDAWGIQQESKALQLLATLVKHHTFKHYLLTGCFLETSQRSGVVYMFRKLRPTIAMSSRTGRMRILACLCAHPIAHYDGSWGGAMCPTDDVIAHLMLMRGDERLYWKRCNQHPADRPQAGV